MTLVVTVATMVVVSLADNVAVAVAVETLG